MRKVVDKPLYSFAEDRCIEIQEQPYLAAGQSQVGQDLGVVNGLQPVYDLKFNYHQILNEQIHTVTAI